jgi:transglutaminase-like putative cysteine protease
MHAAASAPLPAHDEKTDAVLLYSETNVSVQSADKIKTQVREAYKILRPGGRELGTVVVPFNPLLKITSLKGWCIPAQGKDYEVKEKEAVETSLLEIQGGELYSDVKDKILRIPAPDPGNVIGYEYELEERPLFLQNDWEVQGQHPTRESHYSLQLPPGWEFRAAWLNYPEVKPIQSGGRSEWTVSDVKPIRPESSMPPMDGVGGQMIVYLFPPGGAGTHSFATWKEMGEWYTALTSGRRQVSPEIKQQVAAITAAAPTTLDKMKALAQFMQHDIRYVAIKLGIGGVQPHPASEVLAHRYGDCKDKATLMSAMLQEIGVDSYYVVINHERDAVRPEMPVHDGFDHVVLAIRLPENVTSPTLVSTMRYPKLGTLLFFDPTNEITPFGEIGGYLQANYGLLVTPDGGELVELPRQPSAMNSIQRTGRLTLDPSGTLKGEVVETRVGDSAWAERARLRTVTKTSDQVKPIEDLLASSLSLFTINKATIENLHQIDQPFGFHYSFEAQNYAKNAGGLLLVRPRVLGVKTSGILETKEPRKFPIEFDGPSRDTDTFEIAIPAGYVVDDLPPAVDADYSFASYHAKTEVKDNLIHYTRTLEVKELTVPVARADELKKFYRMIAGDERNTVVLKTGAR